MFRLKNCNQLSKKFFSQQYRFRDINVLDLKNFRIQVHSRKFLREHVILMDSEIICILFRINQSAVSLKFTTAAFQIRETLAIAPRNIQKEDLTFLSNASQGSLYLDFCCRECISCLLIKYSRLTSINYCQNRSLYNQTDAGKENKGSLVLLCGMCKNPFRCNSTRCRKIPFTCVNLSTLIMVTRCVLNTSHKINLFLKFIETDGISVIDVFCCLLFQIS